jgi:deoxyribose-phosphate aldolase
VVGFPLGATTGKIKAAEAELAIAEGATEVDMVINIGALKAGDTKTVEDEVKAVVTAARKTKGVIVKVIVEACLLTDAEKETVCRLLLDTGADFVKTSTGFSTGGATAADVALFRRVVGDKMRIKAAGGVRTLEDAQKMIAAGADRLGSSNGVAIVSGI